jgi:hypothetical protein
MKNIRVDSTFSDYGLFSINIPRASECVAAFLTRRSKITTAGFFATKRALCQS